jgi:hypothetical protein
VHCLTAPTAWTCEAHCRCDAAACAQTLQRAPFIHGIERHGAAEHVTACNIHEGSGNIARHDDHATQRPGFAQQPGAGRVLAEYRGRFSARVIVKKSHCI